MPILPTMTLDPNKPISIEDVYALGLFEPGSPPATMEALNGGLDATNFDPSDRVITPRVIQMGSFAMGFSSGFERVEKVYARQLGSEPTVGHEGAVHAALSHRLFIPFAPSCFIFGYQAFFQQDATRWDIDATHGGPIGESWISYLDIDGVTEQGSTANLPFSRFSTKTAATAPPNIFHGSPTPAETGSHAEERRFRFVSKSVTKTDLTKGYHDFKVRITANIRSPDSQHAKCKSVVGSFFAIAIR